MNEKSFESTLVQTLKGAAASILWALLLAGSRLNKGALSMVTGYTDKPVSRALTLLTEMGLVEGKDRAGWQFSSILFISVRAVTALANEIAANVGLGVAAKQNAVRQNARAFAGAPERADDVQQIGVIALLAGRALQSS